MGCLWQELRRGRLSCPRPTHGVAHLAASSSVLLHVLAIAPSSTLAGRRSSMSRAVRMGMTSMLIMQERKLPMKRRDRDRRRNGPRNPTCHVKFDWKMWVGERESERERWRDFSHDAQEPLTLLEHEVEADGLTCLPDVQGVCLSRHSSTQQWRGIYPGHDKLKQHAPSFGGTC